MKKALLAFAGAMTLLTGSALADGMARSKAASCCDAARPWTGFYIGAGVGAGAVVHELEYGPLNFNGLGGEGFFGTVTAGYDRQLSSRVVGGVFVDYDFSDISTDLSAGGFSGSADHKHSWSIGARLGLLSSPTTLWYGSVGYTEAKFDVSSSFGSLDIPEFKGYFLGAGVESQLHGGWNLRGEYRYSQFDAEPVYGPLTAEPSMHTGRVVLTYKWGREESVHAPMK